MQNVKTGTFHIKSFLLFGYHLENKKIYKKVYLTKKQNLQILSKTYFNLYNTVIHLKTKIGLDIRNISNMISKSNLVDKF